MSEQDLTKTRIEICLKASTGGLSGFIVHKGRYPNSVEEYNQHLSSCAFCQRKDKEYEEQRPQYQTTKSGVYRHFKGKYYMVIGEATHSETRESMIIYFPLYGDSGLFVRPKTMFFEEVNNSEYNYKGPRFQYTGN